MYSLVKMQTLENGTVSKEILSKETLDDAREAMYYEAYYAINQKATIKAFVGEILEDELGNPVEKVTWKKEEPAPEPNAETVEE